MSPEELLRLADAAVGHDCGSDSSPEDCPLEALEDQGFAATKKGIARARRVAKVEMAGRKLVDKLDKVTEDSAGIFSFAAAHGVKYAGPQYGEEQAALRQALDEEGDEK